VWPSMDAREATAGVLERASALLGRPVVAAGRGGASDAAHFAYAHLASAAGNRRDSSSRRGVFGGQLAKCRGQLAVGNAFVLCPLLDGGAQVFEFVLAHGLRPP